MKTDKARISLYIDQSIITQVDRIVDNIKVRSRSDAVESLLNEALSTKRTAVILAGGDPSKMYIDHLECYKQLIPVGDRTLIEDIILKARHAGFYQFIIVGPAIVNSKIYEKVGDGKKYDVDVKYIDENKPLGNARTLEKAKKYLNSDFLLLPGDHFFDFDLRKLHNFHKKHGDMATFAIHHKRTFQYFKTSVVEMDGTNVVGYEEHPEDPKTNLVCAFIGFLNPKVFDYLPPGDDFRSLQVHVFPKLSNEGTMHGYLAPGNWVNVHDLADVELVNALVKKK